MNHTQTDPPQQYCPICGAEVSFSARYPAYVCRVCYDKATDITGRKLDFYNEDATGGYLAEYADTHTPYDKHECYINGIECYAGEARFGGIVIIPVEKSTI